MKYRRVVDHHQFFLVSWVINTFHGIQSVDRRLLEMRRNCPAGVYTGRSFFPTPALDFGGASGLSLGFMRAGKTLGTAVVWTRKQE